MLVIVCLVHTRSLQSLEGLDGTSDSKAEKNKCEQKFDNPTTPTTDYLEESQFR